MKYSLFKKIFLALIIVIIIAAIFSFIFPTRKYKETNYYAKSHNETSTEDYTVLNPYVVSMGSFEREPSSYDSLYYSLRSYSYQNSAYYSKVVLTNDDVIVFNDGSALRKEITGEEGKKVSDYSYEELKSFNITMGYKTPVGYEIYDTTEAQSRLNTTYSSYDYSGRWIVSLEDATKYYSSGVFFVEINETDSNKITKIIEKIEELNVTYHICIYNPSKLVKELLKGHDTVLRTYSYEDSVKILKGNMKSSKTNYLVPVVIVNDPSKVTKNGVARVHRLGMALLVNLEDLDNIYKDDLSSSNIKTLSSCEDSEKVNKFNDTVRSLLELGVDSIMSHNTNKIYTVKTTLNSEYKEKYNFKEETRTEYIEKLNSYYDGLDKTKYSEANQKELEKIYNAGLKKLNDKSLNYESILKSTFNEIKAELANVKTTSQELTLARNSAVQELRAAYLSYNKDDYSDEKWSELEAIYEGARGKIVSITDKEEINNTKEKAIKDMAEIEKK